MRNLWDALCVKREREICVSLYPLRSHNISVYFAATFSLMMFLIRRQVVASDWQWHRWREAALR